MEGEFDDHLGPQVSAEFCADARVLAPGQGPGSCLNNSWDSRRTWRKEDNKRGRNYGGWKDPSKWVKGLSGLQLSVLEKQRLSERGVSRAASCRIHKSLGDGGEEYIVAKAWSRYVCRFRFESQPPTSMGRDQGTRTRCPSHLSLCFLIGAMSIRRFGEETRVGH